MIIRTSVVRHSHQKASVNRVLVAKEPSSKSNWRQNDEAGFVVINEMFVEIVAQIWQTNNDGSDVYDGERKFCISARLRNGTCRKLEAELSRIGLSETPAQPLSHQSWQKIPAS